MIKIYILNGSEYALRLFNNFEIHNYNNNFDLPVIHIYKNNKLLHKIYNFNAEYLYDIWLSLF